MEARIVGSARQMGIRRMVSAVKVVTLVLAGIITAASAQNEKSTGTAQPLGTRAASDHRWDSVFRQGVDLRLKGNYSDALSVIKQVVAIARGDNDPRKIAISLNMLGLLYWFEGELADAEPTFKEAIALIESKFGSTDTLLMSPLGNLALVYQYQYRFELAESLFRREFDKTSLQIREKFYGPTHPAVAAVPMTNIDTQAVLVTCAYSATEP